MDSTLDSNAGENVRIGLAKKFLLPMLEVCDQKVFVEFFSIFGKHFE